MAAQASQLDAIEHIVVLMLCSRSFDHMLGYLYTEQGNVSSAGHSFEGLTGTESNPDSSGEPVTVFRIEPTMPNAYFMPGADPGEGYQATNNQLFGARTAPSDPSQYPTNSGFVNDFGSTLRWQAEQPNWAIRAGTTAHDIMGCFTPQALPVLSGLARGFAVCDHWYSSVPTETLPNRAFACAATSQGHMDDKVRTFTSPSIFALLESHNIGWAIYGYNAAPLTRSTFPDIADAPASRFGKFADFTAACAAGSLPSFCFLEPSWGSVGNSQHPPYNVALGEQLIYDVYQAVRAGPGWPQTLLVITYDYHGGCYDHVPPPSGAVPPDESPGEFGFDFTRFGVRVPAVLVSPLIPPGTVFRAPAGSVPLDHTSILKTVEERWNLPALTARDAAALGFGDVLTLGTPRSDDVLAGVSVPDWAAAVADSGTTETATAGDRPRRRRRRVSADSEIPESTSEAGAEGDGAASEAAARQLPPKAQLTRDSWTIDDKLGYEAYADAIAAFIRHPDTKPPLTIGIKGPWGSGKTSLMRMVEQKLDPRPEDGEPQTIPLDPDSREKVSPSKRRRPGTRGESHPPRVSNREVFKKAGQPHSGPVAGSSLATEPPAGERDMPQGTGAWRPTVWFNPWMYQSGEQIWAGFAYEIITQVTRRLPLGDRERFWLRLNLARFDREVVRRRAYRLLLERLVPVVLAGAAIAVLALAVLILARLAPQLASSLHRAAAAVLSAGALGVLAAAIVQSIRFGRQSASVAFGGLVNEPTILAQGVRTGTTGLFSGAVTDPDYQSRTGFLHLVNTDMRRVLDIFATTSRPLVVFVDDLDRCSPGAVVQVIEAINLFLAGEFRNCIFVLAMEPDVVAADIEVAYQDQMERLNNRPAAHGWDTLGWRFLDKIVQLPLSLPPVDKQLRTTFVRGLLNVPASPTAGSHVAPAPGSGPAESQPGGQVDAGSPVAATPSDKQPATTTPGESGAASDDQAQDGMSARPDAKEIAEIEKLIRDKNPDQESLRRIAQGVQDDRLGQSQPLTEATIAAVNRVFADLYSDRQAFEAIESALPELDSTNPREIKRYINLFRFYKFIAYRKHLDGAPDTADEEIARLAALVIRWPDLVSVLMMPGDDGHTNLTALTRVAVETVSEAGGSVKIEAWAHLLVHIGLQTGDAYQTGRWEGLRRFLADAHGIAEVAERFI